MSLYKEYMKMPETAKSKVDGKEIKFSISYNREGVSWATSQRIPIGYRVSVVPVEVSILGNSIVMESFGAFTGFNDTLIECTRQSKKRLQMAIDELQKRKDRYMQWFIESEVTV